SSVISFLGFNQERFSFFILTIYHYAYLPLLYTKAISIYTVAIANKKWQVMNNLVRLLPFRICK
ncbi:hypothetical protein WN865_09700, partial [Tetragenococcus halophilus]